ncbi:hypothetical protein QH494_15480 [Sphingomonas sp. AR_OL41]|uniref:hypothetical protein n=1 Tax=Sphingomonas sp. AR_OL41 TaxID=3042729 RepID=UPI00247FB8D4|nr:hypothetical protein [Sphingomonas sp. AR_OL41]MDH7973592.1 hypothetical protein [Sphingomonas sp. AR_OL41]
MKQFFGGLLLAIGILIMTGSGLCTVVVIGMGLSGGMSPADALSALPIPLIVGGVPFLIGLGLFFIGRNLSREQ